jgi:uncharacterized LabA/DUF88 family protein
MGIGAIFVDGGNVSHSLKRRSIEGGTKRQKIEYGNLVRTLEAHPRLVNGQQLAFPFRAYYTAHHSPAMLTHRAAFYDHLRGNGWSIFDTPSKLCEDGIYRDKGVDLAIALDAYALVLKAQVDTLVVVTHDEDFAELFKRLPPGVRGVSVGFKGQTSIMVQRAASEVIWLDDLVGVLR